MTAAYAPVGASAVAKAMAGQVGAARRTEDRLHLSFSIDHLSKKEKGGGPFDHFDSAQGKMPGDVFLYLFLSVLSA